MHNESKELEREAVWEIKDFLNYGEALERRLEHLAPTGSCSIEKDARRPYFHLRIDDMVDAKFCIFTLDQLSGILLTSRQQERLDKWYRERGMAKIVGLWNFAYPNEPF